MLSYKVIRKITLGKHGILTKETLKDLLNPEMENCTDSIDGMLWLILTHEWT